MISWALIIGGAIVGAGLVAAFWRSVVDWLKRAADKVKEVVRKAVVGVRIFIKKMGEAYKEISKHYSKNGTVWEETIVQRECRVSEVPKEIREKAERAESNREVDISRELEMQLSN